MKIGYFVPPLVLNQLRDNWHGLEGKRNFFFINNQRLHVDAFANQHNEITSVIFNSNTNIILGILGGCMIYVALYTTKNTHNEDIKDYANAGKLMMRKL